jgi:hypothetical protein
VSIPDDPLVIAAMLRARLDEIDAVAISRALRIYGAAHARLLEQVMALIESLGDPTQPVPSNALALASRAELLTQIETVLTRAGVQIEPTLIEARQQAVAVAMEAAEAMAGAQAADMRQKAELARDWAKLNERAVKELVESTADGEPLGPLAARTGAGDAGSSRGEDRACGRGISQRRRSGGETDPRGGHEPAPRTDGDAGIVVRRAAPGVGAAVPREPPSAAREDAHREDR